MQLSNTKSIGVQNDHDRGIGNINAHFNHGRRHKNIGLTRAEPIHDLFFFSRRHTTMQQFKFETTQFAIRQSLNGFLG